MKTRMGFVFAILALGLSTCAARHVAPSPAAQPGSAFFDLHLKQGLSLFSLGEYGKAAAELREAVAVNPGSFRAHNYLGLCYFQQNNYDLAGEEFEKAVELDRSFATAYNNLGGVYAMKLQFGKAEEMFKKALSLSPDMISANYSLGMLLANLGKEEGAAYLARGIALDPDYLEKHKEFISTFTSLSFDMKEAYFAYAKVYASIGNVDKTVTYLEKARKAGFSDWRRILEDKIFEKIRDDPRIRKFLI